MSASNGRPSDFRPTRVLHERVRPPQAVGLLSRTFAALLLFCLADGHAQVAVSQGGMPTYSQAIAVPPGVAGMAPSLSLAYAGGGVSGPVGHGWSVQGLSIITRCPATRSVDGAKGAVTYSSSDKLCLDGQRLIQTDAAGTALAFPQGSDALGLGSGYREFRTEKDSYARVRAYGYASGDSSGASGPAYFKVWTKSGQIYDYGASPVADANTQALINAQGKTVAMAWAVARVADTLGNFIDFKYERRDVAWGSGPTAGSPTLGHEWNIAEIQYSGNKVIFNYVDRVATTPQDAAEAYHQGAKNVSMRLLKSITTYVNSPNPGSLGAGPAAVAVKTVKLGYDNGPISGRSRVTSIQECVGSASSTRCQPAASFTYAPGGTDLYQINANFKASALATTVLQNQTGTFGLIVADFDGDGRSDFIRWSDTPSQNQLYLSNGDGSFRLVANGTGSGQFNISTNLFKSDGCYVSMIADFNGDGLPDILRYAAATATVGGAACPTPGAHYIFLNNGNGSFTQKTVTGAALQQKVSMDATKCGGNPNTGPCAPLLYGWTAGANFYLVDIDGDGKTDIITAELPAQPAGGTIGPCTNNICTHVYMGDGLGNFTERPTNLAAQIVFQNPPSPLGFTSGARFIDVDGDGLQDLVSMWNGVGFFTMATNSWRSRGDGNFDLVANPSPCTKAIDFNGDGRADCVLFTTASASGNKLQVADGTSTLQSVAGFNLVSTGQELSGTGIGVEIADINGDGRQDILRWEDAATSNALYLSKGDGTFVQSTSFNLGGATPIQLQKTDGTYSYAVGDFTGRGNTEILRMASAPTAGDATSNLLLVKTDPTPPDQLLTATSSGGIKTTVYYAPLSNPVPSNGVSGSYGARYASDRGTSYAAGSGKVDLSFPMYVVATSVSDSGVGAAKVTSEYSYLGLKADINGRGLLGFREVRRQAPGANGDSLSTFTQYLQSHPYIGAASRTQTRYGTVNNTGAQLLSTTINVYCDQTAAAGAETSATESAPCATSAKVQRPYLRQSQDSGNDLNGAALPQVTTTNTYNGKGDPTNIVVTTSGSVAGVAQTFTKNTTNTYFTDDTNCSAPATCNWILGRLNRASVQSTVPNSLASISTSAGSNPNASATTGSGQTQFATLTSSLPYGNITVGASSTLSATLTNTGGTAVTLTVPSAASVSGADFSFASTTCTASLAPNASCTISVKFAPTAAVARSGTLSVSSGAGSLNASLSGSGATPVVAYQPASANWGTVGVASDSGDWPVIKNNSNVSVLITAHTTVSGPSGMWSWQGTSGYCIPGTTVLAPGGSCQTFFGTGNAAVAGSYSAVDQISYQAQGVGATTFTVQQSYTFSLGSTTASAGSVPFGNVAPGSSSTKTFTLTNNAVNGGSLKSLAFSTTGANASSFAVTHNCGSALAQGASCTVTVTFTPGVAGSYTANLAVQGGYSRMQAGVDSGYTPYPAGVSLSVALSGTGAASSATLTSPASQTFPAIWYGAAAQTVTVTYRNDGNAPMTLNAPALAAPLSVSSNNCSNVAVGASCSMVVSEATNVAGIGQSQSFTPTGAGSAPAATTLNWTVYTAVPRWGATSLSFGNVTVGQSSSQNITLFNDGNVAYNWAANNTIANAPAGYSFNTSACASVAPNGGNCNVVVTFTPPGAAVYSGSGITMSAASYNNNSFSVSGTGTSPTTDTLPWANGSTLNFCGGQFANTSAIYNFTISGGSEVVTISPMTNINYTATTIGWANGTSVPPGTYQIKIQTTPQGIQNSTIGITFAVTGHTSSATVHTYEKLQCP